MKGTTKYNSLDIFTQTKNEDLAHDLSVIERLRDLALNINKLLNINIFSISASRIFEEIFMYVNKTDHNLERA